MLRNIFIICITLLIAASGGYTNNKNSDYHLPTIALIPLDSRPANTYSPLKTAQMSGFQLLMPEMSSLDNYKKPSSFSSISNWLNQTDADYYLISVSQLCYGGLVASRTSDVEVEEALNRLETIKELKKRVKDKPIFVFDTIQRLAITSSDSRAARYYSAVHNWAIIKDEVENLGREYKREELEALENTIPEDILNDYLSARERNHVINKKLIDMVNDGVIDYLVFAQDDASVTGLHRKEREILKDKINELGLNEKIIIFPGADEVGVVLVLRAINKHLNLEPSFSVSYRGTDGNIWVAPFEDVTFAENIRRHIKAIGGKLSPESDISLFVATPGGNNEEFVTQVNNELKKGKRVVVCDVSITNRADPVLFLSLTENVDLTSLSGYAGWNTAGNTLGFALGQGVSHIAREKSPLSEKQLESATLAYYEYLLHRFAKDYYYKNIVQSSIERFASQRGYDTLNLPKNSYLLIEERLNELLLPYLNDFYKLHFASRTVNNVTLPTEATWEIELSWPRFFEISILPNLFSK